MIFMCLRIVMAIFYYCSSILALQLFLLFAHLKSVNAAPTFNSASTNEFDQYYKVLWGQKQVKFLDRRRTVQLLMDRSSGSGFGSRANYLFGCFSIQIKLIPNDSAGTVTAFYMSSGNGNNIVGHGHDEIDFEFLGNREPHSYILQTNIFVNGIGKREQRIHLWFDPSAQFHTYTILWNHYLIMFAVDDIPIRIFKNNTDLNVGFPCGQPMQIMSSLWNGEKWATDGGRKKINWKQNPFVVSMKGFDINDSGCCHQMMKRSSCMSINWWESNPYTSLDSAKQRKLKWVRENYMVYDYCSDRNRYPIQPSECSRNI